MRTVFVLLSLVLCAAMATAQNVSVIVIHGHSMVPVRYVTESFGATVSFSSHNRQVGISLSAQQINMTPGSTVAFVGGRRVIMDAPPVIIAGVVYVPVRFVSMNLGMDVLWLEGTQQIRIIHPKSGRTIMLGVNRDHGTGQRLPPGLRYHGTPGHNGTSPGHAGKEQHGKQVEKDRHDHTAARQFHADVEHGKSEHGNKEHGKSEHDSQAHHGK